MKKALVIGILALAMAGSLMSCNQGGGSGKEILVGYVINNMNDTFQTYVVDAFKAYFADKPDYTVEVQDAQEDVVKQQDHVNNLIAKGAKALVVVPVNTSAMGPITQAAQNAKIPLVYVNRNPFGEANPPDGVYYVGSQEIVAGTLQGEAMGAALNGQGGVGILMGKLDNEGAILRTQGNKEVITAKFPNVRILAEETGNWQRDQGLSLTENWITTYGADLKGILANNDEMALGAVEATRLANRTDILVMGVDAIPDALVAVANGTMAGTVLQDAAGQGRGAADAAFKALTSQSQDPINWIPFVLVDKSNLSEYQ
ncbi:MAG: substrate-binding domain-containing protein [Spirochaetaceae bacterium]|jgi:inositol transport system substrate-binding protein|nr:substrate-binding domain-containing protein [Spirochaetaceae bacterium]